MAALIESVRNTPMPQPQSQVSNQDIAQQILANARFEMPGSHPLSAGKAPGHHPSVISRVFDVLLRPEHTVTGAISAGLKHGSIFEPGAAQDIAHGAISGLAGTKKLSGSDLLSQMGVENKVARGVGGFGLDLALDPTSYIGPGLLKGVAKGGVKAVGLGGKLAKETPAAVPEMSLIAAGKTSKIGELSIAPPERQVNTAHTLVDQAVDNSKVAVEQIKPKPRAWQPITDAGEISVAQRTAAEYARKLKIKDKIIGPKQQGLIFRNFLSKTGNDPIKATGLFDEAGRFLETQGYKFTLHDGTTGKLVDVIDEMGGPKPFMGRVLPPGMKKTKMTSPPMFTPGLLREFETGAVKDPALLQATENIRARTVMQDAPRINEVMNEVVKLKTAAEASLSSPKAENVVGQLLTDVKKAVKAPEMLISPAGVKTMSKLLDAMDEAGEGVFQVALDKNTRFIHMTVAGDTRKFTDITEATNRAKSQIIGQDLKTLGDEVKSSRNKWFDTLASSFSTWYKNPELRAPAWRSSVLARNAASMRVHALQDMLKGKEQHEINAAWKAAQGYAPTDDPLANQFRTLMEDLFSSSGIVDEAHSTALRSGTTMKDLNQELDYLRRKYPGLEKFKFMQGQHIDPITGDIKDFSGTNWLKSWEVALLNKPQDVVFGIQTAVEVLMKKYGLVDEIVGRWGSRAAKPGYKLIEDKSHALWRAKGYYLPAEIADQVPQMFKQLDSLYRKPSELGHLLDQVLGMWKRGVTIYVPSHHIRNLEGDTFIAWLDGVTNPKWYRMSQRTLWAQRSKYKDVHVSELVGQGAAERSYGKGRTLFHTKNGIAITDDMLYQTAFDRGLLLGSRDIEDIMGDEITSWKGPFGGHVYDKASKTAQLREHFAILAHYAYAINKSKKTKLPEILQEAADRVRKYHPNGTDITGFERSTLRRIFPFYSWTRKAIPLLIESLLFNPKKIAILPKVQLGAQTSMGIEGVTAEDPFPVDQAFPDWMREQGIGPMGKSGVGGLMGLIGGLGRQAEAPGGGDTSAYTLAGTNTNPFMQLMGQFSPSGDQGPLTGPLQMLNPAAQLGVELGTGKKLIGGAPVGQDPTRYAVEQTPLDPIYRILNRPGASTGKTTGSRINWEALLNTATAAGVVGTGPYIPKKKRQGQ
jgi:hypothetical protein